MLIYACDFSGNMNMEEWTFELMFFHLDVVQNLDAPACEVIYKTTDASMSIDGTKTNQDL